MNRPARHRLAVLSITAASALCAPAAMANEALLGRNLAATCANCHGTDGKARGDMKTLAGTPADKLVAMMNDYRSGNPSHHFHHHVTLGHRQVFKVTSLTVGARAALFAQAVAAVSFDAHLILLAGTASSHLSPSMRIERIH